MQSAGVHHWYKAPSGTAGTAVSFSESMRIDTSGNLLVGQSTTVNPAGANITGIGLSSTGYISATRDGDFSANFNRKTSDGTIVQFNKDGTTVGSIGTYFGDLYISSPSSTDAGIGIGASKISPTTTTGSLRDAAIDLGQSAGRFKDLYLSGGVYLGGTVAANKLDDYETGTWTPTFTNLTLGNGVAEGRYTKIGRTVTLEVTVTWGSTTSASGTWHVNNIPFVSAATHRAYGTGNILDNGTANHTTLSAITESQSNLYFAATYITGTYTRYSNITDTIPMTWTTGDFIKTSIVYTAA
jgi:hypothetical protein